MYNIIQYWNQTCLQLTAFAFVPKKTYKTSHRPILGNWISPISTAHDETIAASHNEVSSSPDSGFVGATATGSESCRQRTPSKARLFLWSKQTGIPGYRTMFPHVSTIDYDHPQYMGVLLGSIWPIIIHQYHPKWGALTTFKLHRTTQSLPTIIMI
jgi:hypothetical protein